MKMMQVRHFQRYLSVAIVVSILCCIGLYQYSVPTGEYYILQTHCTDQKPFLNSKCSFASKFKAFVYPDKKGVKPFKNLLYGKEYFTDNPDQACVLIYSVDENATNLSKLKYWGENGENHLILNLNNNNLRSFNTGCAQLVQSTFSSQKFRPGFDFLSPLYNQNFTNRMLELLAPMYPLKRKWFLSYMESYDHPLKNADIFRENNEKICKFMKALNKEVSKLPGKIFFRCSTDLSNWIPQHKLDRNRIFIESMFTIIQVPSDSLLRLNFQRLLLSAICKGAIPVLIGTGRKEGNLPLEEYVSWDKIVVWLPSSNIEEAMSLIRTFGESDINQMKQDGRYAIEMLLSHKGSILACILETIIKRLHLPAIGFQPTPSQKLFIRYPNGSVNTAYYHQPNAYNYGERFLAKLTIPPKVLSFTDPHLGLGKSWPEEKFTVLIVTYHREKVLKQVLSQYKNLPFLDRVVLVWNAPDVNVNERLIPDIGVPVYVISNGKNDLNNRFLPFDVIRTQAVFTVDDDITLENGDIILAFRAWRENRDRIVGFPARYHRWDSKKNMWLYVGGEDMGRSLILTGATFLHKHYFYLYSYVMNPAIRAIVYRKMNCEDLAMNMLVAHVTRKSPLKIIRQQYFPNKLQLRDGLSLKPKHGQKRTQCLNEFSRIYRYMPLIYTQYEVNYLMEKQKYNERFYKLT